MLNLTITKVTSSRTPWPNTSSSLHFRKHMTEEPPRRPTYPTEELLQYSASPQMWGDFTLISGRRERRGDLHGNDHTVDRKKTTWPAAVSSGGTSAVLSFYLQYFHPEMWEKCFYRCWYLIPRQSAAGIIPPNPWNESALYGTSMCFWLDIWNKMKRF